MFDLGCILNLCPSITLKKRKRKFGVIERIESQLFQKVCGAGDESGDQQPLSQVEEGDYSDLVGGRSINQVKDIHNQATK